MCSFRVLQVCCLLLLLLPGELFPAPRVVCLHWVSPLTVVCAEVPFWLHMDCPWYQHRDFHCPPPFYWLTPFPSHPPKLGLRASLIKLASSLPLNPCFVERWISWISGQLLLSGAATSHREGEGQGEGQEMEGPAERFEDGGWAQRRGAEGLKRGAQPRSGFRAHKVCVWTQSGSLSILVLISGVPSHGTP